MPRKVKLDLMSKDDQRYHLMMGGKTAEEIAEAEGVKLSTVNRSIAMVQGRRASSTIAEVQRSQIEIVNSVKELEKAALASAFQATKMIDVDGKKTEVPDHDTRMAASKVVTQKVEAVMPKGKGVNIQVNQQQQNATVASDGSAAAPFGGFEDVLRRVAEKRQAALPAAEPPLLTGEAGDAGS